MNGLRHRVRCALLLPIVGYGAGCATAAPPAATGGTDAAMPASRVTTAAADATALYHAAITLVEASLRLHETDRAKQWLQRAPAEHRGWEWRYLSGQSDRSSGAIPLEGGVIEDLAVSPDGRIIAAAMANGQTHLIDAATGSVVRTLEGHTASAWTPAFTRDGRRLATVSSDGTARIWDVASARQLRSMPGNGRGVAAVAWSPDDSTLAVSSWDYDSERGVWGTLNLYDPATGARTHHIEHGGYPIASLTYSADGQRLFGGTWDSNLLVWDAEVWGEPRVLPPPTSGAYQRVADFALSPDGSELAIAYFDDRVRIWNLDSLTIARTLHVPREGNVSDIADVIWLDGGARLATVGGDLTVRLWNAKTTALLATYHGHERPAVTLAASPDGRRLYTGGAGGRLRVWHLDTLDPARTTWPIPVVPNATRDGTNTVYDVAFDPRGERAVVTTFGGWLRIMNAETGEEVRGWQAADVATVGVDWSPDGRWIASTDNDGRVVVWDAHTGERERELHVANRQLLNVAFSPDGTLLAAPSDSSNVRVWRVPSWEPLPPLTDGNAAAQDVAWRANGALAATYSDGRIRLWSPLQGTLQETIEAGSRGTPAVAFDPSGRKIAVALGRSVRIRDVARGEWSAPWVPRSGSARSVAWSPDGERIVAAVSGNTFEIWDSESGETVLRLPQVATAWLAAWPPRGEPILLPLDGTVRRLRISETSATEGSDSELSPADATSSDSLEWRRQLAFMTDRGGTWLTSNDEYRTDANQEPHSYGMHYRMGLGGTAMHGCLWGEAPAREKAVFWSYFTGWDPTRRQLFLQQSGAGGVVGIGHETLGSGISEQRFTAPDGNGWDQRHVTTMLPPDTLLTRSFQKSDDGAWQPRRTYRWIRQASDSAPPC